ncbi:MAG: GntR family transcriptional regulator [Pelagimonas sp.]|jgi:DNA-binding GntR family transcriptional regulator|nr:GntR family transcriptional regulator [Pelagimonas sp.]
MPAFRPIPRQSLPEAIADDLRERILSGDLGEGEIIRQEALAAEYDVSRMPVREALKRLDAEGLVQLTNNRGALVTKHSLAEIGEIFDLRQLIEVDLFRRAIPAMTSVDFARCDKILAQMDASYDADDVAAWGALNHAFHTALYAAAGRGLTGDLLSRVNLHADRYIRMHLSVMAQRAPAKADHHQLLELAREGAVDQACALLAEHIARPRAQLLDLIAARRAVETEP